MYTRKEFMSMNSNQYIIKVHVEYTQAHEMCLTTLIFLTGNFK